MMMMLDLSRRLRREFRDTRVIIGTIIQRRCRCRCTNQSTLIFYRHTRSNRWQRRQRDTLCTGGSTLRDLVPHETAGFHDTDHFRGIFFRKLNRREELLCNTQTTRHKIRETAVYIAQEKQIISTYQSHSSPHLSTADPSRYPASNKRNIPNVA